jgi:hypothetical protein
MSRYASGPQETPAQGLLSDASGDSGGEGSRQAIGDEPVAAAPTDSA